MVKRIYITLLLVFSIIFDVAFVLYLYFADYLDGAYLFPKAQPFSEYFASCLPFVLLLIILNTLAVASALFFKSQKNALRILSRTCIFLAALCLIFTMFISPIFKMGVWHSQTDNKDHFGRIDKGLADTVRIGDDGLSALMSFDKDDVICYYYEYSSVVGSVYFDIYFEVQLSDEEYRTCVEKYSNNDVYDTVACDTVTVNGEQVAVSGKFVITDSTVDRWDSMYIAYSDETQRMYFKLQGDCYI